MGETADSGAAPFSEAPCSATVVCIAPNGFEIRLALRDTDTAALFKRVNGALEWLDNKGFEPKPRNMPTANPNGGGTQPETKVCPVHQVVMKRRTGKGGDIWYSHRAVNLETDAEFWCRGEHNG